MPLPLVSSCKYWSIVALKYIIVRHVTMFRQDTCSRIIRKIPRGQQAFCAWGDCALEGILPFPWLGLGFGLRSLGLMFLVSVGVRIMAVVLGGLRVARMILKKLLPQLLEERGSLMVTELFPLAAGKTWETHQAEVTSPVRSSGSLSTEREWTRQVRTVSIHSRIVLIASHSNMRDIRFGEESVMSVLTDR